MQINGLAYALSKVLVIRNEAFKMIAWNFWVDSDIKHPFVTKVRLEMAFLDSLVVELLEVHVVLDICVQFEAGIGSVLGELIDVKHELAADCELSNSELLMHIQNNILALGSVIVHYYKMSFLFTHLNVFTGA
jgi:hypothetical protein